MRLTGGILAGGEGRRFGGADKGWLDCGSGAFIFRVRDALAPQVDEVIISANRNIERYRAIGHPVVPDTVGAGPAAGLLSILEAASHPAVLCVPCDALELPATLARDFGDAQWAEEADVVVLTEPRGPQPTCCLVLRSLAPDLRAFLKRGRGSLYEWQKRHRLAHVELSRPLPNVNDEAALAAFRGARS